MSTDPDVLERLARIETKLDHALAHDADHETRIRSVERRVWMLSGAAAVLGGAGGEVFRAIFGG